VYIGDVYQVGGIFHTESCPSFWNSMCLWCSRIARLLSWSNTRNPPLWP